MVKVSPSVLSADFANLGRDVRGLAAAGADYVHIDVMDGMFVPNLSLGFPVISAIRRDTELPLDVHLMIERPIRYVERFCEAGADILTIHVEADTPENTMQALEKIRACGVRPAICVKPRTPAEAVLPYLPLCSLAGAAAYWQAKHGDSKKRIVATCAIFALVPVLNSAFYALNSSYYARWYYMPVLILCAMTASALESPDISADELDAPVRGIGWLMVATLAFALVPVQDGDTKEWSLGVLQNPGQYAAVLSFGIGGLILYRLLCRRWRGSQAFARRMTAVVLAFACAFSMVHIGIGKFGQWHTDSDLVEQYTSAIKLKDDLPEGDWRVDTYKTHDNLGLWLDKSSLQYFGSTAAPSILSFYPALGVKRDVRSEPELSNYALRGLLSVEYLITTPEKQGAFEAEADDGWVYDSAKDGYVLYRNTNYVPMGFTYDYYLTESEYEDTVKTTRSNLLMRALVLPDEAAETYGKYLTHLPDDKLNDLYYEEYVQDCADRRATAASVFQMNNSGFHAKITLEKENLVFFSVPYDDGFTAYVNGSETDILRVDEGLMAVLCPAGENTIDFVYQPDGIRLSRPLTLGGIGVWLVYTAYFVWRKRRKNDFAPEKK